MKLNYLRSNFTNMNNFPTKFINQVMREIVQKEKEKQATVDISENSEQKIYIFEVIEEKNI